ncbi:hypothetical protein LCGC14_2422860, partial [marine sediment metagenome]
MVSPLLVRGYLCQGRHSVTNGLNVKGQTNPSGMAGVTGVSRGHMGATGT